MTRFLAEVFAEIKAACEPNEILKVEYEDLKKKLKELYEPEKNECLLRIAFRDRKQKDAENIQDYVLALKSLANNCKFSAAELENNVKDQLISGVKNSLIRYELLKHSSKTLKELIEIAKTVEIADEKAPGILLKNNSNSPQASSEFHSIGSVRKPASSPGSRDSNDNNIPNSSRHTARAGQATVKNDEPEKWARRKLVIVAVNITI